MQIIVIATGAIGCKPMSPAPGQDIAEVAARDVPADVPHLILDVADLPTGSPFEAMILKDGAITVIAEAGIPRSPAELIAYANAKQWALATGGFVATIAGAPVPFSTALDALGLMDGKVMRLAQPNSPVSVNWQVGPTAFVSIEADAFVHAATLVSDFVQATFDALPAVFGGIASGTITTRRGVDAAAWPVDHAVVS